MERALVVHLRLTDRAYRDRWAPEESAKELTALVEAAGVEVAKQLTVERDRPTPAYFMGKGKAESLHGECHAAKADAVVFGEDLSFPQQRNLEDLIGVKVIDRTQLILDIFAQRARSQEGKAQVELAQLEYLLPRLSGKGILLSRLGGGIGTRGPGEQKLEMDRRRIRLRISRVKKELIDLHRRRGIARQKRQEEQIPTVALIGYTNVGKTTLLNTLTQTGAMVHNQLFTTLDPLARRFTLPNHQPILLSDTVGFLHRIPHHLIEAFRATLEEVTESHLLLHLVDASCLMWEEQSEAVHEVLQTLGCDEKPMVVAFNKVDRVDSRTVGSLQRRLPEAIFLSALTGEGIPTLLDRLIHALSGLMQTATIRIIAPYHSWVERIYTQGQVLRRRVLKDGIELTARIPRRLHGQLAKAGLLIQGNLPP